MRRVLFLFIIFSALSCKKEINFDFKSSISAIVINCELEFGQEFVYNIKTNKYDIIALNDFNGEFLSPHALVQVTKTASLTDSINNPNLIIKNAFVTISDKYGNIDTLQYLNGYYGYKDHEYIKAEFGSTYKMDVIVDGIKYSAISYCPARVDIDTAFFIPNPTGLHLYSQIEVDFDDPVQYENYYYIEVDSVSYNTYTKESSSGIFTSNVYNDRFFNGKKMQCIINLMFPDSHFSGWLVAKLYSIDKANYDFYRTLISITNNNIGSFLSVTPSNPISNFSNGALGHFSVCWITSQSAHLWQ